MLEKPRAEEMWLLQRICEEGRPFYPPLPTNFNNCKRGVKIEDYTAEVTDLFVDGKLVDALGTVYAIHKDHHTNLARPWRRGWGFCGAAMSDLIAICCLVENAKANVIECEQEQDLLPQSGFGVQC